MRPAGIASIWSLGLNVTKRGCVARKSGDRLHIVDGDIVSVLMTSFCSSHLQGGVVGLVMTVRPEG